MRIVGKDADDHRIMDEYRMVARFTGAILGLLSFTITVLSGLWAGNPVELTLSRAVWAMAIFCVLGLAVGAAAQAAVREYQKERQATMPDGIGAGPSQETEDSTAVERGEVRSVGI